MSSPRLGDERETPQQLSGPSGRLAGHPECADHPGESERAARIPGYTVVGMLGHGGMGVVWDAEHDASGQRVALKVMRNEHVIDGLQRRMFRREAEALARLEHPGIATLFDSGQTDDGHDYFSMEIVHGPTLDRWLAGRTTKLDREELENRLRVFRSICHAVHSAHCQGVVHRDIKPSNLIVTGDDQPGPDHPDDATGTGIKILDFGLASITDSDLELMTIPDIGVIRGTLQYMSPEQARCDGRNVGAPSDVYSLGVVLYEMLAGVRPYEVAQSELAEALQSICEKQPAPLKHNWAWSTKLDTDLVTIVGKALEKDIDRRYRRVAELSDDIERYLTSQPIVARPPGTIYRLRKLSGRFFEQTALAVVMVVVNGTSAVRVALRTRRWAVRPRRLGTVASVWIDAAKRVFRRSFFQSER